MERVAMFEKISEEQWFADCENAVITKDAGETKEDAVKKAYEKIKLPERSTSGSAGYDFCLPYSIFLKAGESIQFSTGIKCNIQPGYVLMLFPRSSIGYKYNIHLANTVGIIDSDYYGNETNEGSISVKLVNDGNIPVILETGSKVCQGILVPFGITYNDNATGVRTGGTGSTGA